MKDTTPNHRADGRAKAAPRKGGAPGLVALVATLLLLWAPALAAQAACGTSVTVRSGDTLAEIAARCGTTVSALVRANDQVEDPDVIRVGWVLTVPTRTEQASPEPEPERPERDVRPDRAARPHTVSRGETLALIAREYGTTIRALVRANAQIEAPALIRVGWVLEIPGLGDERRADRPVERPDEPRTYPDASVRVREQRAAPGERVRLSVSGFPAQHAVEIGVGPWRSEFEIIDEARTDANGRLSTTVQMPDWADPGDRFVFVVEAPDHDLRVVTEPIRVIRPDRDADEPRTDPEPGARVRILGTLTDEGVECQALRSREGDLFTLAGEPEGFENGDRVQVQGTVAEFSFCQQGTTIEVRDMTPLDESDSLKKVIRVEGRITEGVECPTLRARDGTLYSLVGNLGELGPGDEVYVEGTEAEASICQQGTTLEVSEIRPRNGTSMR